MVAATDTFESAILARLLELDSKEMSPEVARYVIELNFPDDDRQRMNELAALAREGELSEGEKRELDSFLHVADLLAVWQSRARQSLAGKSSSE